MAYAKLYTRINWVNKSEGLITALGASNLNTIDYAVNELDNRVVEQEIIKADKSTVNGMVKDWSIDQSTGIITVTKLNGEKLLFDLNVEKIPVSFSLSPEGILTMITSDGTKFTADIGNMIPVLTFQSTDTIAVTVIGSGKSKTYSFAIKDGSVTEGKLQPNFLADIKAESKKAENSAARAVEAESSVSASEIKTNESATAAKESELASKASETASKKSETAASKSAVAAAKSAEEAAAVSAVDIATTAKAGIVKPDGTSIKVDESGILSVIDEAFFKKYQGIINEADLDTFVNRKSGCYRVTGTSSTKLLLVFNQKTGSASGLEILTSWTLETFRIRGIIDSNRYTAWKDMAFLSSNVASATKLATARTINGVSFDGTKDINIPADDALDAASTNPVQNAVVTARLNECFQSVSEGKSLIASAITDKGVDTAADATFTAMASNIGQLGDYKVYYSGEFALTDVYHGEIKVMCMLLKIN